MFDGQGSQTFWNPLKIVWGIVFWLIAVALAVHQIYGWPPNFAKPAASSVQSASPTNSDRPASK
jgi:hypothetical protein